MKRIFLIMSAMLLTSLCAFAQSGNSEPLKGDVNGDGKVDVADIVAILQIMKEAGGTVETTTYYTYIGTDPTYKIVDANGDLTSNAATNLPTMPGVVTSNSMPSSINDAYPVGTEISGNGDYVYIIALESLFNKDVYFTGPTGFRAAMDDLGTFTIGNNTYKVLSTRGKVSKVIVQ